MDLYAQIVANLLQKEDLPEWLKNELALSHRVEGECYQALKKIKAIIEDDSLKDAECFIKIDEIVSTFEELGSGGGSRHDF